MTLGTLSIPVAEVLQQCRYVAQLFGNTLFFLSEVKLIASIDLTQRCGGLLLMYLQQVCRPARTAHPPPSFATEAIRSE